MAQGRVYTATSNLVSYGTTTTLPIMAGSATSTAPFDIWAIRVGIHTAGTAPTFPSNTSLLCQLSRTTGAVGGGSSIASTRIAPHNTTDVASNIGYLYDASSAAITGLTQGVNMWQGVLPFTAGQEVSEWVTPGAEWRVSASTTFALFVTSPGGAGTETDVWGEIVWSE
jgi:hypothetical protein